MITHSLKLKNRVVAIQYSGEISGFNHLDEHLQEHFPLSDESAINDFIKRKNKTIIELKNRTEELENEILKIREESYAEGHKEGRNAGHEETKKQIEDVAEEFAIMTQSLRDQFDQSLERMNEPLLELAIKIAEKIIGKELQFVDKNDEVLIDQIKRMLSKVVNQNSITIRFNPNYLDWINKDHVQKELNITSNSGINFVSDDNLIAGECSLETEDFIIDGLLSRQMSNIKDKILGSNSEWIG